MVTIDKLTDAQVRALRYFAAIRTSPAGHNRTRKAETGWRSEPRLDVRRKLHALGLIDSAEEGDKFWHLHDHIRITAAGLNVLPRLPEQDDVQARREHAQWERQQAHERKHQRAQRQAVARYRELAKARATAMYARVREAREVALQCRTESLARMWSHRAKRRAVAAERLERIAFGNRAFSSWMEVA